MEGAEITMERLDYVLRAYKSGSLAEQVFCAFIGPSAREVFARFCALDLRSAVTPVGAVRPGSIARQPGIVLTRDRLLEDVWGFAYPGETRTVDVHVKQLRDKLAGADAKIETVWGVGYKLIAPQ